MHTFTVLEIALELTLGVCIKLFCDNGRIHWRDLANDFLFWVPALFQQPADGLTREVAAAVPFVEEDVDDTPTALAAK
jgi:hypothetical protein